MEKLTREQLFKLIRQHNEENHIVSQFDDEHPLMCVMVFKSETWPDKDYSLESRSYRFRSDNKYFVPGMCGNSVFADALDGSDAGIRLEWYWGGWKLDYCYIEQ